MLFFSMAYINKLQIIFKSLFIATSAAEEVKVMGSHQEHTINFRSILGIKTPFGFFEFATSTWASISFTPKHPSMHSEISLEL